MTLHTEVIEINQHTLLKLVCSSCWIPSGKTVDFLINETIEDSVRQSNGNCYHKGQLCKPDICACSPEGNSFTWILPAGYTNINVSCEMIFDNELISTSSTHRATVFYDGKGNVFPIVKDNRHLIFSLE